MDRVVKRVPLTKTALPKLTRVAAYARVSSAKDAMHHSLSAQVSYYSSLIQRHPGWQYAGVFAAVACNQLITAALPWPRQRGDEDAVLLDAFGDFLHGRILPHLKGMIGERMQLRERNLNNYFLLRFRLFGWHGLFARFFLRCFFRHRAPPVGI